MCGLFVAFSFPYIQESVSELRATNQAAQCLGNRVEMAITKSIENNKTLLKVGLQFEFNDCRNRVAVHLQKNLDRIREVAVVILAFYGIIRPIHTQCSDGTGNLLKHQ